MSNLDKTKQLITPPKKSINVLDNKADTLSKKPSSTNLPIPTATSSKPRSDSRSSRKDESFSKRVPMEEELDQPWQLTSPQEQEIEYTKDIKLSKAAKNSKQEGSQSQDKQQNNGNQDFEEEEEESKLNNGPTLNSSLRTGQGLADPGNLTMDTTLLAQLEKAIGADVEKKFFTLKKCLLCGTRILRKFKGHIKDHINGKRSLKSDYSFCLHADGKALQVKCKNCPQTFTKLTANKLQEHNQVCNSGGINSNNAPRGTIDDNTLEELEKKIEGKFKTFKDQIENEITDVKQDVKAVKETVQINENVLIGIFKKWEKDEKSKEPMTIGSIWDRLQRKDKTKNVSKEKERERDRSSERARNGSPERMTTRQRSRDQRDQGRESERYEDRRHRRGENSEERSRDRRQTTKYENKRQQSYYDKGSNRRN